MVLLKSVLVQASDFLQVLNEGKQNLDQEYVECNVEIPQDIVVTLTNLLENHDLIETYSVLKNLPHFFQTCSFLQIPVLNELLVQLLNSLCQYDDPALVALQGTINLYWLGDQSKLKAATKVWLGLLSLPLKTEEEDDSCFSSLKLLSDKLPCIPDNYVANWKKEYNDCITPPHTYKINLVCKTIVKKIIRYTPNDFVCIELIQPFLAVICAKLCKIACRYGRLNLLRWARARGCPWSTRTCAKAARFGHLEIIQWARANCCPWDECTCLGAAEGGQLEVLQWARANGCPCDDHDIIAQASINGHSKVLQWALCDCNVREIYTEDMLLFVTEFTSTKFN